MCTCLPITCNSGYGLAAASCLRVPEGWGSTTSLDPGYDPSESWEQDLVQTLEATDLFFPNEVEALAITRSRTPEQSLQVLANGRTLTVVKLGAQGCLAMHDGQLLRQTWLFL